jgi:hypothetical protein
VGAERHSAFVSGNIVALTDRRRFQSSRHRLNELGRGQLGSLTSVMPVLDLEKVPIFGRMG